MSVKKPGFTPKTIRNKNYQIILNILRQHNSIPVRDLAEKSGLSKTAVNAIIAEMQKSGIVQCDGKGDSTDVGGRRPETYSLKEDIAYCICVYFTNTGCLVSLHDTTLKSVDSISSISKYSDASYNQIKSDIVESINHILSRNTSMRQRLVGIFFLCSGIVSYPSGVIVNPIPYHKWGLNLPFISNIKERLPVNCPIYIDNSIRLDSYYCYYDDLSLLDRDVTMIYYLNESIGGSVIKHSQMVHGHTGIIGEFGHIITDYTCSEICSCGKTGCIESVAAHSKVVAKAKKELYLWPTSILQNNNISFQSISNSADQGDAFACRQMDFLIQQFSSLMYNLNITNDSDIYILKCYVQNTPLLYFKDGLLKNSNKIVLSHQEFPLKIELIEMNDSKTIMNDPSAKPMKGAALFCFDMFFKNKTSIKVE